MALTMYVRVSMQAYSIRTRSKRQNPRNNSRCCKNSCPHLRLAVLKFTLSLAEVSLSLVSPSLHLPGLERIGLELYLVRIRVVFGLR